MLFSQGLYSTCNLGRFWLYSNFIFVTCFKGAAILEAAESIVYVDGILPFAYVNPSVDKVFSPKSTTSSVHNLLVVNLSSKTNSLSQYQHIFHMQEVQNYYNQLKEMIQSGNEKWATIGIDSLKYYENLSNQDEDLANAEFSAAANNASSVIKNYRSLATTHIMRSAASELYSASIEFSALQYRSGVKSSSVTDNAISAIDSATNNFTKMNSNRTFLYSALESNNVIIPNPVGLGNLVVGVMSKSSRTIKVHSEVINFGNGNV